MNHNAFVDLREVYALAMRGFGRFMGPAPFVA